MTTTLAPPVKNTVLADLLLVRMGFPNKKRVAPVDIRKDIGNLLEMELSSAEFEEMRNELASTGFLTKGKRNAFYLTDSGRQRALRFLGVAEFPPRATWKTVIAKFLFPKATNLTSEAVAKLDDGDKLAAFLLQRKYGLKPRIGVTVSQVLQAIVCKELGFSNEITLEGLLCTILSRLMGAERLSKEKIAKQLPLFQTGLRRMHADEMRRKLVHDWLTNLTATPPPVETHPPEPFDLSAFSLTVRALASRSPAEDRFHENKVFIAALWRTSQREPNFPRLTLAEFKQRLVEANAQHLLHLSRADMVQEMDSQLVAESETLYLNATFHFVLLEEVRP